MEASNSNSDVLSIGESWAIIEEYLKENEPEQYTTLKSCSGATEASLRAAEQALGYNIPSDLRESLAIHDLNEEIPIINLYGYALSLEDMVQAAKTYESGPLAHRLSFKNPNPPLKSLLPILCYDQDRTYFFMLVDAKTSAVAYVDFGDLVGDPTGRIVAWNFKSYLSSFATNLKAKRIPYNHFPEYSFGFAGTNKILNRMPVRRLLTLSNVESTEEDNDLALEEMASNEPSVRDAIDAAMLRPDKGWAQIPTKQPKVSHIDAPLPAELLAADVSFPNLKWDPSIVQKDVELREDGKYVHGNTYSLKMYGDTVFTTGKHYFEVEVINLNTIFGIGLCSGEISDKVRGYAREWYYSGLDGYEINETSYVQGCSSASITVAKSHEDRLKKRDIVGVLVGIHCNM